ncbi:site-specific integrase [Alteromonadaceae bacterium M269]|nr:site-specific integrase [Alteromonadaceae bacterium M269]
MASINVRKETGKLYIDFRYNGYRCREQTPLKDTASNRRALKTVVNKIEAEILLGTFDYLATFPQSRKAREFALNGTTKTSSLKFSEFAKEWLEEQRHCWRKSYLKTVFYLVHTKINPFFDKEMVCGIKHQDILRFRDYLLNNDKKKSVSEGYVNRVVSLLKCILKEASIRFDIADPGVRIIPLKTRRLDIEPFSFSEVSSLIETVNTKYRDYLIVRFFTGLRTAELHGLRWRNVDFIGRKIRINESLIDGELDQTKSKSSDRFVDMNDLVHAAFVRLKDANKASANSFVFINNDKPFCNRYFVNSIWYPLLDKLNLKKRRPYSTRHTAASLWLAAGENPTWIANQLGHRNTQMLFEVYARFVPSLSRNDGEKANQLFNKVGVEI